MGLEVPNTLWGIDLTEFIHSMSWYNVGYNLHSNCLLLKAIKDNMTSSFFDHPVYIQNKFPKNIHWKLTTMGSFPRTSFAVALEFFSLWCFCQEDQQQRNQTSKAQNDCKVKCNARLSQIWADHGQLDTIRVAYVSPPNKKRTALLYFCEESWRHYLRQLKKMEC